jgi:2-(1,2-epoxy-1,2-dihydrophenyl)acetyl-CoA isomerase
VSAETILLDVTAGIAVITLNRPDKLNAFAGYMRERLIEALDLVTANRDVRVLVITGAGKGFCSGGDVQHMVDLKSRRAEFEALEPLLEAGRAIVTRLAAFPYPVIAAVNGVAAGAGCNLALACDVRLASTERALARHSCASRCHPDWGGTYHLPRLAGTAGSTRPVLDRRRDRLGRRAALGLVQRVFPAKEFEARWREYAAKLAAAPATSVRAIKRTMLASRHTTLEQCLDAEAAAQAACWAGADSGEGLAAFVEKRAAKFSAGGCCRRHGAFSGGSAVRVAR